MKHAPCRLKIYRELSVYMAMTSINTKYKIPKRDLAATLETIKRIGFDEALRYAYDGSVLFLQKEPAHPIATTYLAWSGNLLSDARAAKSEPEQEKFFELSKFYRLLSHRIYWMQRAGNTISVIKDFMQLVPVTSAGKK